MLEFERARVSLAGYRTPLSVLRTVPPWAVRFSVNFFLNRFFFLVWRSR